MNIVQENTGELSAILKVQLKEEDYKERVEKALKDLQKKAQMPGFRPGKVPFGMVKKMYGISVLADEVNKVLMDAVYEYIKEKEINILGQPLPNHEQAENIDWNTQKDFEFEYEIGIAPEVNIKLEDGIEVDYNKIVVEDKILDDYLKDITRRYGKMISPEVSEKDDVLYGEFVEMDAEGNLKEEGLKNTTNLFIQYVKDAEVQARLIGMKAGDTIDMNLLQAMESDVETASILGVKKEELGQYGENFRFSLQRISRIEPAELNEELFTKAAPDQAISTEEEFRTYLRTELSKQYQADADRDFKNVAIETIVKKANLSLPEAFLKRWIIEANRENKEVKPEEVEQEFAQYGDSFKWQLIENHLIKEYKLEVSTEEVINHLKDFMRGQMKQYGQPNPDDEILNDFAKRVMSNKDEARKVYDQLFDVKVLDLLKEKLTLKEKEVTFDEFVKMMTDKYKSSQQ